jgi:hypothetical protein
MDAEEALKELGIPFIKEGHHHATEGWLQLDCPRCSPGTGRYRLGLNLYGCYLSCWVCGSLPLSVLSESGRVSPDAVRKTFKGVSRALRQEKRPQDRLQLPHNVGPLLKQHRDYLSGRGYDPEHLRAVWKLKGTDHQGEPPWHVVVPIHQRGELVSWTCRSLSDSGKRYHNARPHQEAVSAKSLLYGMDHARHVVLIHEGAPDVWAVGPGAVATLGLTYTRQQLSLMASYPVRYVCLDSEPDAQKRARNLCEDLASLPGATHNVVLDSKDAGAASDKEIKSLRRLLR